MGKGETVLISEQCSETIPFNEDQVIPKGQVEHDIVSFNSIIPNDLRKLIIFPSCKVSFEKESNMGYIAVTKGVCMTTPPISYSDEKTAFSDSSVSFVSAVKGQDRSFVLTRSDDLPNQPVCTRKSHTGVLIIPWKNERNHYFSSMESLQDQVVLSYCQAHFRKCPGGRGNASGGGAAYTYATSSDMQYSWVTGASGGGGGTYGGYAGSAGDDDDPWKQRRPIDMTPSHYNETFNILEDLDEITAAMLRNDIFPDLDFGLDGLPSLDPVFNKDPSANVLMEDPSDPAPMTPAPTTPASHYVPSTPSHIPVSSPVPTQAAQSDIEDLLQIQQIMRAPSTLVQKPLQSSTPGLSAPNTLLGQTLLCNPTPASSEVHQPSQPMSVPSQPNHPIVPLNFFDTTMYRDLVAKMLVVTIAVKNDSKDNHLAYQALQHCCSVYSKYQTSLQQSCNLPVAVQSKAKLCSMNVELSGRLRFTMPEDCVSLSEWMEKNSHSNDVRSCQLILQQIVNTLVILFQGPNDLCFWGSYQVYVASNKQIYLYIDFEKFLAIQKAYAENGITTTPRSEDCRLLAELYNSLLKPIIHRDMTWISPQLNQILVTFEQLTAMPSECVRQMAVLARVLGERRICKLQVNLTSMQCNVYAVEHEPVSSALQVLGKVVPVNIANMWAVLHVDGSQVNMTEICAREGQNTFFLLPNPLHQPLMPGALYIGNC